MDLVLHPGLKIKELNEEELREFANLQDRLLEKLRAQLRAQTSIPYQEVQNEAQRILQEYAEQSLWFDQSGEPMRQNSRRRRSVLAKRITRPAIGSMTRTQRLRKAARTPVVVTDEDKSLTDSNSRLHAKKKKRYDSKLRNYPRPWAELKISTGSTSAGSRLSASSIPSDLSTLVLPPLSARSSLSVLSEVYINVPVSSSDYFDDVFTKRHQSRYYQQHVDVQKPKELDTSGGTESPLPPGYLKRIVVPWVDPKTVHRETESTATDKSADEDEVNASSENAAVNLDLEPQAGEPKVEVETPQTSDNEEGEADHPDPDQNCSTELVTGNKVKPSSVPEPLPDITSNSKSPVRTRPRSRSKKKNRKLASAENDHSSGAAIPVAKEPFRPAGKAKAKDKPKTIEPFSSKKKSVERPPPAEIMVNHVTLPEQADSMKNITSTSKPTQKPSKIRRSKRQLRKIYKEMISFNNFENTLNELIDERNSRANSCVNVTKNKDDQNQGKLSEIGLKALPSDINRNMVTTEPETTVAFMKPTSADTIVETIINEAASNAKTFDTTGLNTRQAITRAQTTVSYCSDLELSQSNLFLPSSEKTPNTKLVNETEAVANSRSSTQLKPEIEKAVQKEKLHSVVSKPVLFDEPIVKAPTIISKSGLSFHKYPPLSRRSSIERIITSEIDVTAQAAANPSPCEDKSSTSDSEQWDEPNQKIPKEILRAFIRKPVLYDEPVVPASETIARSGMPSRSRSSTTRHPLSRAENKVSPRQCNSNYTVIPKIVPSAGLSRSSKLFTLVRKPAESKLVEYPNSVGALLSSEDFRIKLCDGSTRIRKLNLMPPSSRTSNVIPALKQTIHTDIDLPVVKVKRSSSNNSQQRPESSGKIVNGNIPTNEAAATKVSEETPATPTSTSKNPSDLNCSPKRTYELLPRVATKSLLKLAKASIKRRESFTKVWRSNLQFSQGEAAISSNQTEAEQSVPKKTSKNKLKHQNDESLKTKRNGKFKRGQFQLGFAEVLKYSISDYKFHDATPPNMAPVVRMMASKTNTNIRLSSTEILSRNKQFPSPTPAFNCWKGSITQRMVDSTFQKQKAMDEKENGKPSNSKSTKSSIESVSAGISDSEKLGRKRSKALKSITHGWNIS